MHFEVQMPENGRKMVFRAKQTTTKLPVIFLNGRVLKKRWKSPFGSTLTKKQGAAYRFSV